MLNRADSETQQLIEQIVSLTHRRASLSRADFARADFAGLYTRLYPGRNMPKSVTFVVTEDCNLRCSYCYERSKTDRRMSFRTAQKCVDFLFTEDAEESECVNPENADGLILDFIGGEPLLEIELIDQTVSYFLQQAVARDHRWKTKYIIGISSNGVKYFDPAVQAFLQKYDGRVSISITVDGSKELHDSCRVFPDGTGSYDQAAAALASITALNPAPGTKLTIAPGNISHLAEAVRDMHERFGIQALFGNFVFEDVWKLEHAATGYKQLREIADWMVNAGVYGSFSFELFNPGMTIPRLSTDDQNWCGGNARMLAFGTDGRLYPCVRFCEMATGPEIEPYTLGDVDAGFLSRAEEQERFTTLRAITRTSQSSQECIDCPISSGCSWCTAYNYQVFGTPNKRATFICEMHKARALATCYFWNRVLIAEGSAERFPLLVPPEWGAPIIGEEEYALLSQMSQAPEEVRQ